MVNPLRDPGAVILVQKMAQERNKSLIRLAISSLIGVFAAQLLTFGVWMLYLLSAFMIEGSQELEHFSLFPNWLWGVIVAAGLLAIAVNLVLYRRGAFDEGNLLFTSRDAARREMLAHRRSSGATHSVHRL